MNDLTLLTIRNRLLLLFEKKKDYFLKKHKHTLNILLETDDLDLLKEWLNELENDPQTKDLPPTDRPIKYRLIYILNNYKKKKKFEFTLEDLDYEKLLEDVSLASIYKSMCKLLVENPNKLQIKKQGRGKGSKSIYQLI